jgi:hypothetical protein
MEQSPFWVANRFSGSQEITRIFMEPEGSLPHSQVLVNCFYPEPVPSSPYPPHTTSWKSILILSSHVFSVQAKKAVELQRYSFLISALYTGKRSALRPGRFIPGIELLLLFLQEALGLFSLLGIQSQSLAHSLYWLSYRVTNPVSESPNFNASGNKVLYSGKKFRLFQHQKLHSQDSSKYLFP